MVEVCVEGGEAFGGCVEILADDCSGSAEGAEGGGEFGLDFLVGLHDVVEAGAGFEDAVFDPGFFGAFADDAGAVLGEVLEDIGVDGFEVFEVEVAGDGAFEEFADSVGDDVRLARLIGVSVRSIVYHRAW